MGFDYDGSNVDENATPWLVREPAEQCLQITAAKESKSKSGYNMAVVDLMIVGGKDDGKLVKFHNVTFMPETEPGAGMAVHFLKSIGEPVKGFIQPGKWKGKLLRGFVKVREYQGKKNNAVEWVDPWEGPVPESKHYKGEDLEEVPF